MSTSDFEHRIARTADLPAIRALMDAAIRELLRPWLDEAQIVASRTIMGLDTQLIDDETYFVVHQAGVLVGCGGWSRRATKYGGDHSPGRDPALLEPSTDAARVRAMYTHPDFARRGVGRLVLLLCERALRSEGFSRAELVATLAGEPLYLASGYRSLVRFLDDRGGASVPLVEMVKEF
jgi:GNAT superfamily N-acetyltransferase